MALKISIKDVEFGVGDKVRVVQRIKDGDKLREASFEGMVLGIKGRSPGKTFMVRKVAAGNIGVERIFPVNLPSIDKIVVVKKGVEGVRRAKLYYTREKSPTQVEMIHKRSAARSASGQSSKSASMKSASKKK
jgi:large subunit ribosomal protein L19